MYESFTVLTPAEMEPKRSLPPLIPLVAFSLSALPNMNDILYMSPMGRKGTVAASRNAGYKMGLEACRVLCIPVVVKRKKGGGKSMRDFAIQQALEPLQFRYIFTVLDVWHERSIKDPTKGSRKRDMYNAVIKATIDGLTDAGLWEDDSTEYHTDLWVNYRGLADKGKMILNFYSWGLDQDETRGD